MKTFIVPLTAFSILLFIISGCNHENETIKNNDVNGKLIHQSECKSQGSMKNQDEISDTLSCINYSYDSLNKKLIINHINTGFNCCPGTISCDITMIGDTIQIAESEQFSQCNCDCLYDIEIEIKGIESRQYVLKFIEPYAGNQSLIQFAADFINETSGSFCVTRLNYPWGI